MRTLSLLLLLFLSSCSAKEYFLVTGTYTGTGSEGIYVYRFNASNATATLVDSIKSSNPSFLASSKNGNFLYAVNEDAAGGGAVSSFSFDKKNGVAILLNKQSSLGDHPCHIAIDHTGKWLMAANYSSGSVAAFMLNDAGTIDSPYHSIRLSGKGKDPKRQQSAHAHQVVFSPDNNFLYIIDLGSDKIMIYAFDDNTGIIKPASPAFVSVDAGTGPRHMVFHPYKSIAYLLSELTGTITSFSYDKKTGELKPLVNVSSFTKQFSGFAGSAEIEISNDGKFLYASNRGDANNIASFSINQVTGWPMMQQIDSTQGKAPRHFSIHPLGKYMLVANMNSDEIVVFRRSRTTGLLSYTGKRIRVKKPVCLVWVGAE